MPKKKVERNIYNPPYSETKLYLSTKDFNNYIESIRENQKISYKQIASDLGITPRFLLYLRKGQRKSLPVFNKTQKLFQEYLPIYYVAIIRSIIGEFSTYYIVEIFKVRSFNGAISKLEDLKDFEYPDTFIDGITSDFKPEIAERLQYWLGQYREDISNFQQVKAWIRLYSS